MNELETLEYSQRRCNAVLPLFVLALISIIFSDKIYLITSSEPDSEHAMCNIFSPSLLVSGILISLQLAIFFIKFELLVLQR